MNEFYFIQSYKDLGIQIEIHKKIIENAKVEQKYYLKQLHATEPCDISSASYDSQPKGNYSPLPLDKIVENLGRIDSLLELENNQVNRLVKAKNELYEQINGLTGLYFKVAQMKEIDGKSLKEIAGILGYSYDYIREVASKIRT